MGKRPPKAHGYYCGCKKCEIANHPGGYEKCTCSDCDEWRKCTQKIKQQLIDENMGNKENFGGG